ncbi:Uncharacterised protein [uncultured archaeon]|nr:Uncharacterised protein [uncultured archaeon]
MHKPALLTLLLLLALSLSVHALNQDAPNITYNSTGNCVAWTSWAPEHINDVRLNEMGYVRKCQNVTYVSYCISTPVFVNFSYARHFVSLNCSTNDFCQGWTRFYPESEKNITSRTPDNLTRTCLNTTYVSWCIRAYSNVDYRTGRRYSEIECGPWVEACSYVPGTTSARTERSGGFCRSCNTTNYRYTCNYGGKMVYGALNSQSLCAEWSDCPAAAPYAPPSSPSYLVGLDSSNVLVAVLLGVGLTALLVVVMVFSHRSD